MLEFLKGGASDRKLRLFSIASRRRVWQWLTDERSQRAVEVAERFADTDADTDLERHLVLQSEVMEAWETAGADWTLVYDPYRWATEYSRWAATKATLPSQQASERHSQAALLRDIFGPLPFRAVPMNTSWPTPDVVALAQSMYDSRDFSQMQALTELLEVAGCGDREILGHCRGAGDHVRGCWLLDLLLGKE
jgi:hypothetical protein